MLNSENVDSLNEKRFDRMKYYGGLGKRVLNPIEKRFNKPKFYDNLDKNEAALLAAFQSKENLNADHFAKSKKNAYSKKSKIDRLRYMGNIGK